MFLSSASPTRVEPIALTSHYISFSMKASSPLANAVSQPQHPSMHALFLPRLKGLRLGGQALGYEPPPPPPCLPPSSLPLPTGDSSGTAAWQLSPVMGEAPTDALKAKPLKFGKRAAHALAFRLAYLNNYMSEAIPECLGICRNIFHLCMPRHQSQRAL